MSHFIKCDRCDTCDSVMGTLSLPPGWQKIMGADLCEPCSMLVRDFIRFKASDAEELIVEPVPAEMLDAAGGKLFETAPVVEKTLEGVVAQINAGALDERGVKCTASIGPVVDETTTEERSKTKKLKKKMQGQDAILPAASVAPPADPGVH